MAKYAVVRTDKMTGTDVRSELVSVRFYASNKPAAIENGNVAVIGALEEIDDTVQREVYVAGAPAANSSLDSVVLIVSPEIMYPDYLHSLDNFINEAGSIARGYRLHKHDIFSVTAEALAAASDIEIGNVVELQAGTKLKVVSSATNGSTVVGKIVDINVVGRFTFYVIEVG